MQAWIAEFAKGVLRAVAECQEEKQQLCKEVNGEDDH